jgi:hypothetical protein
VDLQTQGVEIEYTVITTIETTTNSNTNDVEMSVASPVRSVGCEMCLRGIPGHLNHK